MFYFCLGLIKLYPIFDLDIKYFVSLHLHYELPESCFVLILCSVLYD
jgi:hypothetical protein